MRTNYDWSADRLSSLWKTYPARSSLHIVPPGSDMHSVASNVSRWILDRDAVIPVRDNTKAAVVSLSVDSSSSTTHFVSRLHSQFSRIHRSVAEIGEDRYPAEWIENIVGAVQYEGGHPVLIINRFHSFAAIADNDLLSVLSKLRELEHDGNVTTIAISPMNYHALRQELSAKGHFPFVNSSYGDNHDEVVMPPLSRQEFVAAANARGVDSNSANRLFADCGGPDCVHEALLAAAIASPLDVVERAARSLGARLDRFFDILMGPASSNSDDLRIRMATGRLFPAQAAYLKHQNLSAFLMKETTNGYVAASPVVARLLLAGRGGPWISYSKVLEALDAGQFGDAARQTALLEQDSPNLKLFAGLLTMLAALRDNQTGGLLEMDWRTVRRVGNELLGGNLPFGPHKEWILRKVRWAEIVLQSVNSSKGSGSRLDVLTQRAADPDIQMLILYVIGHFLDRTRSNGSPGERVRAASSVPESLLQAMAAQLGINPLNAPAELPAADYQSYFGGSLGDYRKPAEGKPLDLTHLLVIVPALIAMKHADFRDEIRVCDQAYCKPLHQTLVATLRNATAHTYTEIDEKTAKFFFAVCDTFMTDAKAVWFHGGSAGSWDDPGRHELADVLAGRTVELLDGPEAVQ